jgi:hypothetical protein
MVEICICDFIVPAHGIGVQTLLIALWAKGKRRKGANDDLDGPGQVVINFRRLADFASRLAGMGVFLLGVKTFRFTRQQSHHSSMQKYPRRRQFAIVLLVIRPGDRRAVDRRNGDSTLQLIVTDGGTTVQPPLLCGPAPARGCADLPLAV